MRKCNILFSWALLLLFLAFLYLTLNPSQLHCLYTQYDIWNAQRAIEFRRSRHSHGQFTTLVFLMLIRPLVFVPFLPLSCSRTHQRDNKSTDDTIKDSMMYVLYAQPLCIYKCKFLYYYFSLKLINVIVYREPGLLVIPKEPIRNTFPEYVSCYPWIHSQMDFEIYEQFSWWFDLALGPCYIFMIW